MEIFIFLLGLIIGSLAIYVFSNKVHNQKEGILLDTLENVQRDRVLLDADLSKERDKVIILERNLAKAEADYSNIERRINEEGKMIETRFENLANKIFEEKSKKFADQNKSNISDLLRPLKERIVTFSERVEKSNKDSLVWNATLREQITSLKESNLKITKEAENLSKALKGDSKIQGDWGEFQLELLLEKAGLKQGIHFTTQSSIRDDDGNLKRPDFII